MLVMTASWMHSAHKTITVVIKRLMVLQLKPKDIYLFIIKILKGTPQRHTTAYWPGFRDYEIKLTHYRVEKLFLIFLFFP